MTLCDSRRFDISYRLHIQELWFFEVKINFENKGRIFRNVRNHLPSDPVSRPEEKNSK